MADIVNILAAAAGAQGETPETDPNFNQTVLLLHGDGTNGAQNNTFLDSSTNNFTITRNGNTTQGTFSPFSAPDGRWSNYLEGTSDYFVLSDYNLNFPAGSAFTIEAWVYLNSIASTNQILFGVNSPIVYITFRSSGEVFFYDNGSNRATSGANIQTNQWIHVAVCRDSSNNMDIYINGVSKFSGVVATNIGDASNTVWIGDSPSSAGNEFPGYIANFRISNSARYSGTFTPSTEPFVNDGNTVLLTCQSNRFVDNSSNGYAITATGTPKVTPFSPFAPTAAYDASVNGGSSYFDGSGDLLEVPDDAAWAVGTGDVVIEFWVYFARSGVREFLFHQGPTTGSSNTAAYWVEKEADNTFRAEFIGTTYVRLDSSFAMPINAWNYVQFKRISGTAYLYINGALADSAAFSAAIRDGTDPIRIGNYTTSTGLPFQGYISDVRFSTADVSSDIPTAPLTATANTELLCNFTNAGIYNNALSGGVNLETVGNAQIDTTTKQFGTGSMEFDGSGDSLLIPSTPELAFGTGDFTIEFWMNTDSVTGTPSLYDPRTTSNQAVTTIFRNASAIALYVSGSLRISGGTVTIGTWHHIALARASGSTRLFIDGTQVGSTFADGTNYIQTPVRIGIYGPTSASPFDGFIDDLRVTKGVARYTSTFTPPDAPFLDL